MKFLSLLVLGLALILCNTSAQPNTEIYPEEMRFFKSQVEQWRKSFSQIKSLDFQTSKRFILYKDKPVLTAHTNILKYLVAEKKYRFDLDTFDFSLGKSKGYIIMYDGESYSTFNKNYKRLTLGRDKLKMGDPTSVLIVNNDFFEPFEFLTIMTWQNPDGMGRPLFLKDLSDSVIWEFFFKNIIKISKNAEGLEIHLRGGLNYITVQRDNYVIFLDKKNNYYPTKWQRVSANGTIILENSVTKIGKTLIAGVSFSYPLEMTRSYYGNGKDEPFSKTPRSIRNCTMDKILFNGEINEDQFIFDPSIADSIFDVDSGSRISVPK